MTGMEGLRKTVRTCQNSQSPDQKPWGGFI